jgi:hypothetical protein
MLTTCKFNLSFFIILLLLGLRSLTQLRQTSSVSIDLSQKVSVEDGLKSKECMCPSLEEVHFPFTETQLHRRKKSLSSTYDEIIDGENYSAPLIYKNFMFLKQDFKALVEREKLAGCPKGYRPMNKEDLQQILVGEGPRSYEILVNSLNFSPYFNYILNTKTYAGNKINSDLFSYVFEGLKLDSYKNRVEQFTFNTLSDINLKFKCMLDKNTYELNISIINDSKPITQNEILNVGDILSFKINNQNAVSALWKIQADNDAGNSIQYEILNEGCLNIQVWALMPNQDIVYGCRPLYANLKKNSNVDARLEKAKLNYKTFLKDIVKSHNIFFVLDSTQIATNLASDILLTYTDSYDFMLHIFVLDKNLNPLNDVNLNITAIAIGITTSEQGYVILCTNYFNSSHMYLYMVNHKFEFMWRKDILYNEEKPEVDNVLDLSKNIIFKKQNGEVEFGINNSYKVLGGTVASGGGKIAVLYSHFNNFGVDDNNKRKDHVGNTLIIFDSNGENPTLGFSWGASPPLESHLVNNGVTLITASLAGAYPDNVQICSVDLNEMLNNKDIYGKPYMHKVICKNLLEQGILSNGKGGSCGRVSDIIFDGEDTYGVLFSAKQCHTDKNISQDKKEFAVVFFDKNLNIKHFSNFETSDNINCIKAAKFGKNIFVAYTKDKNPLTQNSTGVLNNSLSPYDESYAMVVDFNGKIKTQPFKLPKVFCDDISTLFDGSITWPVVNDNESVTIMNIKP